MKKPIILLKTRTSRFALLLAAALIVGVLISASTHEAAMPVFSGGGTADVKKGFFSLINSMI